jgi:thioredoxin-dependent peroxiredoxin
MSTQTIERTGLVTARGNPLTLLGPALKAGDDAPELHLSGKDTKPVSLDDLTANGTRAVLLIVVPSLDTPTCAIESKTFNQRLGELPAGVKPYIVSMDLPFAMVRWCGAENVELDLLSDYRDHSFGYAYGVRVKENGLLYRTIFVITKDKKISYVEVVPDIADQPNYDAVIAAAKAAAGA